jgi:phage replication O-like protein O
MANARLDDGYMRVANALSDAILVCDFSKRELTVLWFIMRMTYGVMSRKAWAYNAQEADERTGIDESIFRKTVKDLLDARVLFGPPAKDLRRGDHVGLQTDPDLWQVERHGRKRKRDNPSDPDKTSGNAAADLGDDRPGNADQADETSGISGQNVRVPGVIPPADPDKTSGSPGQNVRNEVDKTSGKSDETSGKPDILSGSTSLETAPGAAPGDPIENNLHHETDVEIPPNGGGGGIRAHLTKLGRIAPHLDAAIAAGLPTMSRSEEEHLAVAHFGGRPGSFRNVTVAAAQKLATYFRHPPERRQAAWAYTETAPDLRSPYDLVFQALEQPERYAYVFDPAVSRPGGGPKPRPTTTATHVAPLSDEEKARRYTL